MANSGNFPARRMRRLRKTHFIRNLVQETTLSVHDFIYPVFVMEGTNRQESVDSMPGVFRYTIDRLLEKAQEVADLGIPVLALFPFIDPSLKTETAEEALNPDGLIPRAVLALKQQFPDLGVMTDIALDPYSSHGQDGLIDDTGYIMNDETVDILVKQAILHAKCGVDIVAPSDMMDGRIAAIRQALDKAGFIHTILLAYAAKYASAFYGPFRDAVGSKAQLGRADKKTYQMNPANSDEAIREVGLDIAEGADMVMVKPGLPYLDIVYRVKQTFAMPTVVYQVSGEYSQLKFAALANAIDEKTAVLEALLGCKRAGADAIISYYAVDAAKWLSES